MDAQSSEYRKFIEDVSFQQLVDMSRQVNSQDSQKKFVSLMQEGLL